MSVAPSTANMHPNDLGHKLKATRNQITSSSYFLGHCPRARCGKCFFYLHLHQGGLRYATIMATTGRRLPTRDWAKMRPKINASPLDHHGHPGVLGFAQAVLVPSSSGIWGMTLWGRENCRGLGWGLRQWLWTAMGSAPAWGWARARARLTPPTPPHHPDHLGDRLGTQLGGCSTSGGTGAADYLPPHRPRRLLHRRR